MREGKSVCDFFGFLCGLMTNSNPEFSEPELERFMLNLHFLFISFQISIYSCLNKSDKIKSASNDGSTKLVRHFVDTDAVIFGSLKQQLQFMNCLVYPQFFINKSSSKIPIQPDEVFYAVTWAYYGGDMKAHAIVAGGERGLVWVAGSYFARNRQFQFSIPPIAMRLCFYSVLNWVCSLRDGHGDA